MNLIVSLVLCVGAVCATAACADAVTDWNIVSGQVIAEAKIGTPPAVRMMAIVQTAAHQAVQTATHRGASPAPAHWCRKWATPASGAAFTTAPPPMSARAWGARWGNLRRRACARRASTSLCATLATLSRNVQSLGLVFDQPNQPARCSAERRVPLDEQAHRRRGHLLADANRFEQPVGNAQRKQ